jgi:uncharacterized protein (DUF488 family)
VLASLFIIRSAMTLYTIGHSNATLATFLNLLRQHAIELLADTRSQPYSRYSPQFSREALKQALAEAGITYVFLGAQLGGRPADRDFYLSNGKVDFARLAEAPCYLAGIERLLALAEEGRVAYLCSEADYKHCHRYWLITRTLVARNIAVQHILHSGALVASTPAEFEPAQPKLF